MAPNFYIWQHALIISGSVLAIIALMYFLGYACMMPTNPRKTRENRHKYALPKTLAFFSPPLFLTLSSINYGIPIHHQYATDKNFFAQRPDPGRTVQLGRCRAWGTDTAWQQDVDNMIDNR
jgi:hypothetical protein